MFLSFLFCVITHFIELSRVGLGLLTMLGLEGGGCLPSSRGFFSSSVEPVLGSRGTIGVGVGVDVGVWLGCIINPQECLKWHPCGNFKQGHSFKFALPNLQGIVLK